MRASNRVNLTHYSIVQATSVIPYLWVRCPCSKGQFWDLNTVQAKLHCLWGQTFLYWAYHLRCVIVTEQWHLGCHRIIFTWSQIHKMYIQLPTGGAPSWCSFWTTYCWGQGDKTQCECTSLALVTSVSVCPTKICPTWTSQKRDLPQDGLSPGSNSLCQHGWALGFFMGILWVGMFHTVPVPTNIIPVFDGVSWNLQYHPYLWYINYKNYYYCIITVFKNNRRGGNTEVAPTHSH